MRCVAFLLASTCVVLVAAARAQTPQPVFRGGVDLVTLDVTVVDKDGQPIRGLKAEDFVVTLEKQARPVRALDFLEFGSAAASSEASAHALPRPPHRRR